MLKWLHFVVAPITVFGELFYKRQLTPIGYVIVPLIIVGWPVLLFVYARFILERLMNAYRLLGVPAGELDRLAAAKFVMLLIPLSFLVAWFKRRQQFYFGYLELWLAVIVGVQTLEATFTTSREQNFLILIGALYVMTEGATNMYEGFQSRER